MRLGIKGKQVLGVTSIVGRGRRDPEPDAPRAPGAGQPRREPRARGSARRTPSTTARARSSSSGVDPYEALRADRGLRSILESSLYSKNVTFAAIADVDGVAIVHADPTLEGKPLEPADDLTRARHARAARAARSRSTRTRGATFELAAAAAASATRRFGSIRIGVSTLLIRHDLNASLAAGARHARSSRSRSRSSARCCSRSCCCGRFT